MWSYRLVAPYTFERVDIPEKTPESLGDRQVLVRFLAAGVCGSDLPGFRGAKGRLPGDVGTSAAEMDGFPIHESRRRSGRQQAPESRRRRPRRRLGLRFRRHDGIRRRRRRRPGAVRPGAGSAACGGAAAAGVRAVCARAASEAEGPARRRDRSGFDRAAVLLCGKGFGCTARHRRRPDRPRRRRQGVRGRHRGARDQRPVGEPSGIRTTSPTSSSRRSVIRSRRSATRSRRPRSEARSSISGSPTTTATRSACAPCCATT